MASPPVHEQRVLAKLIDTVNKKLKNLSTESKYRQSQNIRIFVSSQEKNL